MKSENRQMAAGRCVRACSLAVLIAAAASLFGATAHAQEADTIYLTPSSSSITFGAETGRMGVSGSNGCVLAITGAQLLDIRGTGSAGSVGWTRRDKQIGVNGTSSGSPCTQVRIGQGIRVGPKEPRFELDDTKVKAATLRIKASPKATVDIKTYRNACTTTPTVQCSDIEIHSLLGQVISSQRSFVLDASNVRPGLPAGDSTQWDYVVVTAQSGNTSSESGSFSLLDSEFTLGFVPEGNLVCDPNDPAGTTTVIDYAVDGVETSNAVQITRLKDIGSETLNCDPLPYRLDFDGQNTEFLADYSVLNGREPAFEWRSDWDPEPIPVPVDASLEFPLTASTFAASVPLSRQQFLPTDPEFVLDLCVGIPVYDDGGTPGDDSDDSIVKLIPLDGVDYDMSELENTQYGCYLKRKVSLLNTELAVCPQDVIVALGLGANAQCIDVQVEEWGFLRGDWTATRTLR